MGKSHIIGVGLDLGGTYTGTFITSHPSDEAEHRDHSSAFTVVNSEKLSFSSKSRTAVRHRVRSYKGFDLRRRLLLLVAEYQLLQKKQTLAPEERENLRIALSGYLKRRGYARTEAETDTSVLESLDPSVFSSAPSFTNFFNDLEPLNIQWEAIANSPETARALNKELSGQKEADFKKYIKTSFPEYSAKEILANYVEGRRAILDASKYIANLQSLGHKHRSKYLSYILQDMKRDSRITRLSEAFGSTDNLWRIIGNISNLQERAVRWYFNDAKFEQGQEQLDASKLRNVLIRALKYLRSNDKEWSASQKQIIQSLESSDNELDVLAGLDPDRTIPPYEDQNNRRPPEDQTLYLNPKALSSEYGDKWKSWANKFAAAYPLLTEDLSEILENTDRKSRIKIRSDVLPDSDYRLSYILQRALDRSIALDECSIRRTAEDFENGVVIKNEKLEEVLSGHQLEEFLEFANRYYQETAKAKNGLWFPENALLERADLHPPMKNKILHVIVGQALGISPTKGTEFIDKIWNSKVKGRSTVRSICYAIENERKTYGPYFSEDYKFVKTALKEDKTEKELSKKFAAVIKVLKMVHEVVPFIGKELQLSDEAQSKFDNPYSLAQLYNLIETERNGFSKVSLAAHLENAWRMTMTDGSAQCCRLPADCVRPFDGFIRKAIDRNSWEVAKRIAEEVKKSVDFTNGTVKIPVAVEANSFNFTASLTDLKYIQLKEQKLKKKLEDIQRNEENQEKRWLSKEERIRSDSHGICAYTGHPLDDVGEIDHIIPRSLTLKKSESIYNSEVNLIFVSAQGNQEKKNNIYLLSNLAKNYLTAVFGTSDLSQITNEIESTVLQLKAAGRLGYFDLLSEKERACARHALFLNSDSEARRAVVDVLGSRRKASVNGTQAWFVRSIFSKVRQALAAWTQETGNELIFDAISVPAVDSSDMRKRFAEYRPEFRKPKVQPVASHSIDAMCIYLAACSDPFKTKRMGSQLASYEPINFDNLFTGSCQVVQNTPRSFSDKTNIANSPIFKETIYAERFLDIIVSRGEIFLGYPANSPFERTPNRISIGGKEPFSILRVLEPYLNNAPSDEKEKQTIYKVNKNKAFKLLSKVAGSKFTAEEDKAAKILEALHFVTVKQDVAATVSDLVKSKIELSKDSIENLAKQKGCLKKVEYSSKEFKFKGSLIIPAAVEWGKVLWNVFKENTAEELKDENVLRKALEAAWPSSFGTRNLHSKAKRVFSLPVVATQSGAVRIRRKTAFGDFVYQSQDTNNLYSSFPVKNGKLDWSSPIIHPALQNPNLTAYGYRFVDHERSISMSEFREVYNKDDLRIELAQGTSSRRYLRVEMPGENFLAWFGENSISLGSSFKFSVSEVFDNKIYAENAEFTKFLPKPREDNKHNGTIFFELVGPRVIFNYIVGGAATSLKEIFLEAGKERS
ncbi:MAG: type II-B CRISPR-associated RNA-guided endonuclease Cas9/Csx12 [Parasutterella sp.]|jgi:5-methylcytosine-specific restriction endonuclease McrA|uniref:HNH endonuclease domain-containing protein n=1 Tax=Parasutterella TaxID=577310 RepID=UPI00257E508A|nr:HNH endonuclease domain-containing protein [Parasutterella sp.]MBS5225437.1 type II-B CRISPR-associated RNA-guided endonuclease Cas9/Csx12 [Parasutterella sp.]